MKSRAQSSSDMDSQSTASFYTYLKPGALAQLRYSKITARSKKVGAKTLLALCQIQSSSDSSFSGPRLTSIDGIPCFNLRVSSYPRCIQRKKLIAVKPFFSQTQS